MHQGKAITYKNVDITSGFWKDQQDVVRSSTIGAVYDRFDETGRFHALTGAWKEGEPNKPHIFWDSDIAKWIEGAAFFLQKKHDPALEAKIDELVGHFITLQKEDGYLNSYFSTVEPEAVFTRRMDHELYCAGHLIEAAIAYEQATGKREFLDCVCRYADLIDRVFRIEHSAAFDTPGHEEIELALMKLYEATGERRYHDLARYFIDTRGTSARDAGDSWYPMYTQAHAPVRRQKEAVGHAVRSLYLYSGAADVALADEDEELLDALKDLFCDIKDRKMALTGGVGSTYLGEAFTFAYDLPDYTTYNETCASIALAMFARRMWLMDPDSTYADVAEAALYNTVLSGVSLSGDRFFYENPLAIDPAEEEYAGTVPADVRRRLPITSRVKVFDCSCCPPNLIRVVGAVGDYACSSDGSTIYLHCYMNCDMRIPLQTGTLSNTPVGTSPEISSGTVILKERTRYPEDGLIVVTAKTAGHYTLAFRIPGWSRKQTITVNGRPAEGELSKGYFYITRSWEEGDEVVLDFHMTPMLIEANPRAKDLAGKTALIKGPVVYCAEGIDNPGVLLRDVRIPGGNELAGGPALKNVEQSSEQISGRTIPTITVDAMKTNWTGGLYRAAADSEGEEPIRLTLIPYRAFANRGVTEMTVWLRK